MKIKPLHRNIIARLRPLEEKVGAIHVPTSAAMNRPGPVVCEVLAVGPSVQDIKPGMELALYPGRYNQLDITERTIVFQDDYEKTIIGTV